MGIALNDILLLSIELSKFVVVAAAAAVAVCVRILAAFAS